MQAPQDVAVLHGRFGDYHFQELLVVAFVPFGHLFYQAPQLVEQ